MTIIFILFFISLGSIILMIAGKMAYLRKKQIVGERMEALGTPHIQEIKYATIKRIRKYEYVVIASSVRFSLRSSRFIREKSSAFAGKVKRKFIKNKGSEAGETGEASKFLKMISDYKHKVKKIKRKVREEEEGM